MVYEEEEEGSRSGTCRTQLKSASAGDGHHGYGLSGHDSESQGRSAVQPRLQKLSSHWAIFVNVGSECLRRKEKHRPMDTFLDAISKQKARLSRESLHSSLTH